MKIEYELVEDSKPTFKAKDYAQYSFIEPESQKRFTVFADGQAIDKMFDNAGGLNEAAKLAKELDDKLTQAIISGQFHGFIEMNYCKAG